MDNKEARRRVEERRLYKRLVISFFDLVEARNYLLKLLAEREPSLHEPTDETVRAALQTAFIVTYARPFSGNKGASDVAADVPGRFVRNLPPAHRTLHKQILKRRNEEFAHSDPAVAKVRIYVSANDVVPRDVTPVSSVTRVLMPDEELRRVGALCEALYVYIFDEMQRLRQHFLPGERF